MSSLRQKTLFAILLALAHVFGTNGLVGYDRPSKFFVSKSALGVGPLQKLTNKQDYNKVVEGLMLTQGISRQEAEREYNAFLDNPNNYALEKGENYYKSLGYKSLLEGVIGEAEKQGRGAEVRDRIEKFKKRSQLKGLATITVFFGLFAYLNTVNPYVPPPH